MMKTKLKDGMYLVDHGTIYAAFVVRGGEITSCAPVLRKNLAFFATKAKLIPTDVELPPPVAA